MVLMQASFDSSALSQGTTINVLLPNKKEAAPPYQLLFLMSGGFTDHTYFMRHMLVERFVDQYNLAVVMPYMAGRYLYKNMPHGEQWWDFYSEELPEKCRKILPVSTNREDTFATGGSGGALCALKLGLQMPEIFGAVGSIYPPLFSQPFLDEMKKSENPWRYDQLAYHYGDPIEPEYDIFNILKTASEKELKTKLFLGCGTDDPLYNINTVFRDKAVELGFNPIWEQCPGGHSMDVFIAMFIKFLDWLPLKKFV